MIHEAPGQELEVEVYDEDTDADDFLGRYGMSIILPFMQIKVMLHPKI